MSDHCREIELAYMRGESPAAIARRYGADGLVRADSIRRHFNRKHGPEDAYRVYDRHLRAEPIQDSLQGDDVDLIVLDVVSALSKCLPVADRLTVLRHLASEPILGPAAQAVVDRQGSPHGTERDSYADDAG